MWTKPMTSRLSKLTRIVNNYHLWALFVEAWWCFFTSRFFVLLSENQVLLNEFSRCSLLSPWSLEDWSQKRWQQNPLPKSINLQCLHKFVDECWHELRLLFFGHIFKSFKTIDKSSFALDYFPIMRAFPS